MFVSAWTLAGLIVVTELVGYLYRGTVLGWLGTSAAGGCLVAAVYLVLRLNKTADDDYVGTLVGVLLWALAVLIALQFWPHLELITVRFGDAAGS